jgi:hypothetical protein
VITYPKTAFPYIGKKSKSQISVYLMLEALYVPGESNRSLLRTPIRQVK